MNRPLAVIFLVLTVLSCPYDNISFGQQTEQPTLTAPTTARDTIVKADKSWEITDTATLVGVVGGILGPLPFSGRSSIN